MEKQNTVSAHIDIDTTEAKANIEKNEVWLSSDKVKNPTEVRYAFTNYPVTNFENKEGFPTIPFRIKLK